MYQTHRTYITPESTMADLLLENPMLLLMLEHFGVDFTVREDTVAEVCTKHNVPLAAFLLVANLYNGFHTTQGHVPSPADLSILLRYLRNSHAYYKLDKYTEIRACIDALCDGQASEETRLIDRFFNQYYSEVLEHLRYEDEVAFPYFEALGKGTNTAITHQFSAEEYRVHHSDIESALADLRNLVLKHLEIEGPLPLRRRLLFALHELETDLHIHSLVEETILLPLVHALEAMVSDE